MNVKESGIDWIGKIPVTWNLRKIRYLLKERIEKNDPIKSNNILSLTASQGVIPYSEKKGSGGNKPKDDLTKYKLTYPNDIVMNSMNVLSGSVGLSEYFGCVSPVYYMFYSDSIISNIKYYNYIFQTKPFQLSLLGLGNGIMMKKSDNDKYNTIRMRIPSEKINNLVMPFPDIETQDKIVNFLDLKVPELDNIIIKTEDSVDYYKKYKNALIIDTVTNGLNNFEMKQCNMPWIEQIPNHWNETKLKHVATKLKRNHDKNDDMLVCSNSGKVILKTESKTGLVSEKEDKLQGVKAGDLLIHGMDTWHGAIAVSNLDGKCTPVVHVCNTIMNKIYLKYYLQSLAFRNVYKAITNGVRLNTSDFRSWEKAGNIPILVPPIHEQNSIANYLEEKCALIDKVINEKESLIRTVQNYKSSFIYEYVTGKKEIISS